MTAVETLAALLTLAAGFAYVNHRWIRQPAAIALMAMSLGLSLALLSIDAVGWVDVEPLTRILDRISFNETLLHGMLGVLLFAGALHIRLDDLRDQKIVVALLALVGTLLSTLVVAAATHFLLAAVGISVPLGYCLLFGAMISPTDPIAVMGILKQSRVPARLEIMISGESLFNDGVGVVIFLTVLQVVTKGETTVGETALLFLRETAGGTIFGLVSGYATFQLLKSIDHYQTELLITIALVLGGYALAERLHISAPIAAVVAGLVIGNQGRERGMSEVTRDHLDKFWSLVDDIMNAILFVLVGLEVIRLTLTKQTVLAGSLAIPVVLLARLISVGVPLKVMSLRSSFANGTIRILTWGGLRGGISVALALSIPDGPYKGLVVTMTYMVVAFSILVQGLTLGRFAESLRAPDAS